MGKQTSDSAQKGPGLKASVTKAKAVAMASPKFAGSGIVSAPKPKKG